VKAGGLDFLLICLLFAGLIDVNLL